VQGAWSFSGVSVEFRWVTPIVMNESRTIQSISSNSTRKAKLVPTFVQTSQPGIVVKEDKVRG
jgi:hypothetical protein